ncbi:MAG TPA: hypothetical protein VGC09_19390 [Rhodopila sp.]
MSDMPEQVIAARTVDVRLDILLEPGNRSPSVGRHLTPRRLRIRPGIVAS